jgi:3-isopropylmalate/(R)-2-methylmalate dehydratase small subunit
LKALRGRAWKFGEGISTDQIAPGRYFHLRSNLPELAKHVLEDARADFAPHVRAGDFVVAGRNFGLGSSREHAPIIIKMVGVSAVLAKSFARIFYRNAINIGLPAIICQTEQIEDGDLIEVDLAQGTVLNITRNRRMTFPPLPDIMRAILEEGGLVKYVGKNGDLEIPGERT